MSQKGGNLARCDFCGKSEKEVESLIAASVNVHICDSCVLLSIEILSAHADNQKEFMKKVMDSVFEGPRKKVLDLNL